MTSHRDATGTPEPGNRRARRVRRAAVALGITLVIASAGAAVAAVRTERADSAASLAAIRTEARTSAVGRAEAAALRTERRNYARAAEAAARAAAGADLATRITAADAVLTSSKHKVADDALRQTLATALTAARAALPAVAPAARPADVSAAGVRLDAASAAVQAALTTWRQTSASTPAPAPAPTPAPAPAPAKPGVLVWITSIPTADGDGSNGHMPASAMCLIPWGTDTLGSPQYLRCDAEAALTRMNEAFKAQFGTPIALDLTYRSFDEQVAMRAALGPIAAVPGTSNHGLGLALDVPEQPDLYGFGTPRYEWFLTNGPSFGWDAPEDVRQGAAYPEYWHIEYHP